MFLRSVLKQKSIFNMKSVINKHCFSSNATTKDFFDIRTSPSSISTYIDNDIFNMAEAVKPFDIDNLTTIPIISGKFSRLYTNLENYLESIVLTLSNNGLGLGLATVIFVSILRLSFIPLQISAQRSSQISRMLTPDINDFQVRIKRLRSSKNKELVMAETMRLNEFRSKYPGCEKSESKFSNKYDKLIIEAFGGKGDNDDEKEKS